MAVFLPSVIELGIWYWSGLGLRVRARIWETTLRQVLLKPQEEAAVLVMLESGWYWVGETRWVFVDFSKFLSTRLSVPIEKAITAFLTLF